MNVVHEDDDARAARGISCDSAGGVAVRKGCYLVIINGEWGSKCSCKCAYVDFCNDEFRRGLCSLFGHRVDVVLGVFIYFLPAIARSLLLCSFLCQSVYMVDILTLFWN